MNRIFSLLTFISIITISNAQNLSSSPYSGFGLGEPQFDQNIVLSSMAGISSTYISEIGNEVNFSNPAANQNLNFTTFNVGFNNTFSSLKANNLSEKNSVSYISDISLGFALSEKFKFGLGFQPFSTVGYDVSRIDSLKQADDKYILNSNNFKGEGGLNSLHSFVSYTLKPNLSVGLRVNYIFGNVSKDHEINNFEYNYITNNYEKKDLVTGYETDVNIATYNFTTGITYKMKVKENHNLTLGGTFGFGFDANSDFNYLKSTYYYNSFGTKSNVDTLSFGTNKGKLSLPKNFSLGVAYGKTLKWNAAFDFKWTEGVDYTFPNEKGIFQNNYKVAVGGWIIPNINSYKSYFDKIIYRGGFYYQSGALEVNSKDISQIGLTLGIGLPIAKRGQAPSYINLGVEFGRQGTKSDNLIQEDFMKFKIGINLNDIWFRKRKFN